MRHLAYTDRSHLEKDDVSMAIVGKPLVKEGDNRVTSALAKEVHGIRRCECLTNRTWESFPPKQYGDIKAEVSRFQFE